MTHIRRYLVPSLVMMVIVTVAAGFAYPLLVTGVSAVVFPGRAQGSLTYQNGKLTGSKLLGQAFTDAHGNPLPRYFEPRPSFAGSGYDGSASGASNLGPTNPLLVGFVPGVSTFRANDSVAPTNPFATAADPRCVPLDRSGNPVTVVDPPAGQKYQRNQDGSYVCDPDTIPQRAIAYRKFNGLPASATIPVDAVTASGSGLDPMISIANADDQIARVARVRQMSAASVLALVKRYTFGGQWGFLGEPGVNVVMLNRALDATR